MTTTTILHLLNNNYHHAAQPFEPKLHMTDADFHSITLNGRLCDDEGGLGLPEFERMMREQVRPTPAAAARRRGARHRPLREEGRCPRQIACSKGSSARSLTLLDRADTRRSTISTTSTTSAASATCGFGPSPVNACLPGAVL
jgi:hypothetical protein